MGTEERSGVATMDGGCATVTPSCTTVREGSEKRFAAGRTPKAVAGRADCSAVRLTSAAVFAVGTGGSVVAAAAGGGTFIGSFANGGGGGSF